VYHSVDYGGHQARTLFDGVFQLPPGHYLIATEKHLQVSPYWDFNYPPMMLLRLRVPMLTGRPNFVILLTKQFAFVCVPMCRWAAI